MFTRNAAARLIRRGHGLQVHDVVTLVWTDRFIHTRRLQAVHGDVFEVALDELTRLEQGDAFVLGDGTVVEVIAAEESLVEVSGPRLAALAWRIGFAQAPCQIEDDRLLIRPDAGLESRLRGMGATVRHVSEPFQPETWPVAVAVQGAPSPPSPVMPDFERPAGGPFGPD